MKLPYQLPLRFNMLENPEIPKSLENVDFLSTAPKDIKTTFTPSNWKNVVEFIRELLYKNKNIYINFQYKPNGPKSSEIKLCAGYVTKQNVKFLPRLLNRAWSDISLYDLLQEIKNS